MNWIKRTFDIVSSCAATAARFGAGMSVGELGLRPKKPLELYDYEACPFCRKVREAMTMLDVDIMIYPCPRGGKRFRGVVKKKGGRELFPYLVDPNADLAMYESDDIVQYLFEEYGNGNVPLQLGMGPLTTAGAAVASVMRPLMGMVSTPSRAPKKPLELWSFEASPFCRLVREALCSLEIPYLLHNVGKGSPSREGFVKRSGKMMVPYLADPNTDREMFESADIVEYLYATYGR